MSQPLRPINLIAPGFQGLNTQDSPLGVDYTFAAIANNCVIDKYGRIASRKGVAEVSETITELGSSTISHIGEFIDSAGNTVIFSAGNNKILSGTTTLTDETPASYTITSDDWKTVNFNDEFYFFQRGYEPLVYSTSLGAVTKMSSHGSYTAPSGGINDIKCHEAIASAGRLWVAANSTESVTVYWSDTLTGVDWSTGSAGSIDLTTVWPNGFDEIVALAAHQNSLIIFGKNNILIYGGIDDPSTMALTDTIVGVGCIARDSVQNTGVDVLFLSKDGLRSLGRTVQQSSLPIGDYSRNVKDDVITLINEEASEIQSVYSPENSFYLLLFRDNTTVYCFDVSRTTENGAYRTTLWPTAAMNCFCRLENGTLYIGNTAGICSYSGYDDLGESYRMAYYSPNITFDQPTQIKILKKMKPTLIGGSGASVTFKWGYGFDGVFSSASVTLPSTGAAYFNVTEYWNNSGGGTTANQGEYSGGTQVVTKNINTTGAGASVVVGMEADISSDALSLQELNILSLIGRFR